MDKYAAGSTSPGPPGHPLQRGTSRQVAQGHPLQRGTFQQVAPGGAGFTLVEVMVALAILATAMFVLLQAHSSALSLCMDAQEEVTMNNLFQLALGQAETEVQAGKVSGSGEFGKRYPGYSYTFEAQPLGEDPSVSLYDVTVSVKAPAETRTMSMLVYVKSRQ